MVASNPSQRYLSTRGGSYDLSFEEVVLKGLASGGLFIPEEIPSLPPNALSEWKDLSFEDLAFNIFSLYISPSEIPSADLKDIISRSYASFRTSDVTPLISLDKSSNLHLLELFHGPTFAFKDVALQFVGNLFEYFLVRRNAKISSPAAREHLTVIGATSGDTGSAAIYGLRGKKDVSVFIMYPNGKVSPIQEAQMTTVEDSNVHCLRVEGTFDDCQDIVKTLFADPQINASHRLAAVNSINWARILAQITYYFHAYFSLARQTSSPSPKVRFVVPTGNFGDILAGYFAKKMGLPIDKLVIATNENDILHRFWQGGVYEKQAAKEAEQQQGERDEVKEEIGALADPGGVKMTYAPAMDILVSSNFERLLWFLSYQTSKTEEVNHRRMEAGERVKGWLEQLKKEGGFSVPEEILEAARADFSSERVSNSETIKTIRDVQAQSTTDAVEVPGRDGKVATTGCMADGRYILDPHSAIGVAASLRRISQGQKEGGVHYVALATAHPAKFSAAVEMALQEVEGFTFETVLPEQFRGLMEAEKRVVDCRASWEDVREIVGREVEGELRAAGLKK